MSITKSTPNETAAAPSPAMDRLLTVKNAKTTKGEKLGVLTGILYLAPANESGVMNTCASATPECKQACLFTAGRGRFDSVRRGRIRKTLWLARDRQGFVAELKRNVAWLVARARKLGLEPAVRINGTSDLPWLAHEIATAFPEVQFYDYTKHPKPWLRTLPNYSLTFSHSGANVQDCMDALQHGVNVAVVFSTPRGKSLPETWCGVPVIDGDLHDCRFLDPKGVVVGLRAKGAARNSPSPFVVVTPAAAEGGKAMTRLSEWYNAGFRALWRHLRTTAAAYCRTQYISTLTDEVGPEEAQRILEREGSL